MADPHLIAVDWGTTSCRASRIGADGTTLDMITGGPGILAVADGNFAHALAAMISGWRTAHPAAPVILSGMIGSRQGWHEVPYVACPAGLVDVAAAMQPLPGDPSIRIVPGLVTRSSAGTPDVMRGEETQVFGALAAGGVQRGTFVLPGTHAKWVDVEDGRITRFRTFMTGEVYAALRGHTILGRLMPPAAHASALDAAVFARGVAAGAAAGGPGALLNRIFAARTLGLVDGVEGAALADHLSGLLIGAEIAEAATPGQAVVTIGAPDLAARYVLAGRTLGLTVAAAPGDCAARGAHALLRACGGAFAGA